MKQKFEDRRLEGVISIKLNKDTGRMWNADKATICNHILTIGDDFKNRGYRLTLRQLYYQLVSKELIPNHDKVYKKLGGILDDLRYSGNIDWNLFEDRGRVPYTPYYELSVEEAILSTARTYRLDRQLEQPFHIEVWTEKDAISGILRPVCSKFGVKMVVNKGYSSSTAMYQAYTRFIDKINDGHKIKILYFGDHDPSGLDMIRDIQDRIDFFIAKGGDFDIERFHDWRENKGYLDADIIYILRKHKLTEKEIKKYEKALDTFEENHDHKTCEYFEKVAYLKEEKPFQVIPIGLTKKQINKFNPPPNPAKLDDPRAKWYVKEHGNISWEVDAIDPDVMKQIVEDNIIFNMDVSVFNSVIKREEKEVKLIKEIAEKYKTS